MAAPSGPASVGDGSGHVQRMRAQLERTDSNLTGRTRIPESATSRPFDGVRRDATTVVPSRPRSFSLGSGAPGVRRAGDAARRHSISGPPPRAATGTGFEHLGAVHASLDDSSSAPSAPPAPVQRAAAHEPGRWAKAKGLKDRIKEKWNSLPKPVRKAIVVCACIGVVAAGIGLTIASAGAFAPVGIMFGVIFAFGGFTGGVFALFR